MNCNNGNFCWIIILLILFCNCGGNGFLNGGCGCQSNNGCGCESNNGCGCC